jgi:hypothetical protein
MYIIGIVFSFISAHIISSIIFLLAYFDKRNLIKTIKQHEIDDIDNIFDEAFPDIKKKKKHIEKISPDDHYQPRPATRKPALKHLLEHPCISRRGKPVHFRQHRTSGTLRRRDKIEYACRTRLGD